MCAHALSAWIIIEGVEYDEFYELCNFGDFMLESEFQADLIKELKQMFPHCLILKNDEQSRTGIPDLVILWSGGWALLECKQDEYSSHRPNQDWYIERAQDLSFGAFIFPENKEEVLDALQRSFGLRR